MNKLLLRSVYDFRRWHDSIIDKTRGNTTPTDPEFFPCIAVWTIVENSWNAKDFAHYEYIYKEDWQEA